MKTSSPSRFRRYLTAALTGSRAIKAQAIATVKEPRLLFSRKRYILLLSHARCYTTLLGHILGGHDEIIGSSETHRSYHTQLDLIRLRFRVYCTYPPKIKAKYFFDKILFDHLVISEAILYRSDVRFIFTLREPEASIRSILNMSQTLNPDDRWMESIRTPERACQYYIKRLETLEDYCLKLRDRNALYFDAEDLLDGTERLFRFLKNELGLSQDLSEQYSVYNHTGRPGHGDMSDRIRVGRILRDRTDLSRIDVPPDLLNRARDAYDHCRLLLLEHCVSSGDPRWLMSGR